MKLVIFERTEKYLKVNMNKIKADQHYKMYSMLLCNRNQYAKVSGVWSVVGVAHVTSSVGRERWREGKSLRFMSAAVLVLIDRFLSHTRKRDDRKREREREKSQVDRNIIGGLAQLGRKV